MDKECDLSVYLHIYTEVRRVIDKDIDRTLQLISGGRGEDGLGQQKTARRCSGLEYVAKTSSAKSLMTRSE